MGNTVRIISKTRNIDENLGKILNEQRKQQKYCDYVLKTENGEEFLVHKNILELVCGFFEKLFNTDFSDSKKNYFIVKNCSGESLKRIIEFMYTNEIELSSGTIKEITDTSLFLALFNLVNICIDYLCENCNLQNCFELLHYSETIFCGEKLTKKCIQKIYENLKTIINGNMKNLNELSIESIIRLVHYDKKFISGNTLNKPKNNHDDKELYIVIINWINYDVKNRDKYLIELLKKINFDNINLDYRLQKILNETSNPLYHNDKFLLHMTCILEKTWQKQKDNKKVHFTTNSSNAAAAAAGTSSTFPRHNLIINQSSPSNLLAIMGNKIIAYNSDRRHFQQIITKILDKPKKFAYLYDGHGDIFICGGRNSIGLKKNSTKYYRIKNDVWKTLPNMQRQRSGHSACFLDYKIYICGGLNDRLLEIYDMNSAYWTTHLNKLSKSMNTLGLCTLNRCIYAINFNNFQSLDPRVREWRQLNLDQCQSYLKTIFDYKTRAIGYNNFIYRFDFNGINTYDIRINRWLNDRKQLPNNNSTIFHQFEICQMKDKIYMLTTTHNYNLLSNNRYEYVLHSFNASNLAQHDYYYATSEINEYNWGLLAV